MTCFKLHASLQATTSECLPSWSVPLTESNRSLVQIPSMHKPTFLIHFFSDLTSEARTSVSVRANALSAVPVSALGPLASLSVWIPLR
jgi:hypothetical protein